MTIGKLADTILQADIYSQNVYLSVLGKKKVYSVAGLLITLTVVFVIMGFGIYKGLILLQKSQFETQMASVLRPINYADPEILQMNEYGFDFALATTRPLSPEIGDLILYHQVAKRVYDEELGQKVRIVENNVEELELCSTVGFNHSDEAETEFKSIGSHLCMKDKTKMRLGGSYLADAYEALYIYVMPCQNGSNVTCAPQDYIDDYLTNTYVQLRTVNFYFDKDQNDPVQSYIQDNIYFGIVPGINSEQQIRVKVSKAIYDDSISPFSHRNTQEFPQIEEVYQTFKEQGPHEAYLSIALKLDFFSNMYQKKLFSFTDYISQLGGLFNALYGGGGLLMFLFMDAYILEKVMRALYKYNSKDPNEHSRAPLQNGSQIKNKSTEVQPSAALNEASQRRQLDVKKSAVWCCCFRNCNESSNLNARKIKLYERGKQRIRHDLDIVNLFRMMQEFKLIKKMMLSKSQRVLLKWQKELTLYSEDENCFEKNVSAKTQLRKHSASIDPLKKQEKLEQLGLAISELSAQKDIVSINQKLILGVSNACAWKGDKIQCEKTKKRKKLQSTQKSLSMVKRRNANTEKMKQKQKKGYQAAEVNSGRDDSFFYGSRLEASEKRIVNFSDD